MNFVNLCAVLLIQLFCSQLPCVASNGKCLLGGFYFARGRNTVVGYAIQGASFLNMTVSGPEHCFRECSQNCRCISFNHRYPNHCELNDESRHTAPRLLKRDDGSSYYDLDVDYSFLQESSCSNNCCKSNPCKNNTNCTEVCDTRGKRFQCSCPPGFSGNLCQNPPPTSCEGYYKTGANTNGTYIILDEQNKEMTVYCDFSSESNFTWTLIQSFSLANKASFVRHPLFSTDEPIREETPNGKSYRLSQSHLRFIRSHTTHWRATCNFPTDGVDFTDYVRTSFDNYDLMNSSYAVYKVCQKYELVNIRGIQCQDCTAATWYGKESLSFSIDSSVHIGCDFDARSGSVSSEDNFGLYIKTNANFRCTASPASTTQFWFGISR